MFFLPFWSSGKKIPVKKMKNLVKKLEFLFFGTLIFFWGPNFCLPWLMVC